ncbi:MAG TPA: transglycosylase domain-containing protein [Gaiellaceae bacterium]|nr:transglycosylase domain-containing protein [Gaiellaceae bacterium]
MSPRARRKPKRSRLRRIVLIGAVVLVLGLAAVTAYGLSVYYGASCDLSALKPVQQAKNSLVYGANGSLIGVLPAVENRTVVPQSAISPWMPQATVAIEDRRFYGEGGIDPIGILRALVADIRAGHVVEGGSTITQELVRNLYLSQEQTVQRKVVEACLAIKLSGAWSKDRILTAYLNDVYYGDHAYGIEAAAETYFSVPASRLTLEQSALLAGLPQAPSLYDPLVNPHGALARRDEVLHALLVNRNITQAQYGAAMRDRNLHLRPSAAYTGSDEPYFLGFVEDALQQEYGAATVRAGGLKVYTTIEPRLQREAVAALSHVLDGQHDPAGAIVSLDPHTGAVRAMAAVTPGSSGGSFNLVTSAERQAGSTFKPIVLAAAVGQGMNPWATRYLSAPFSYPLLHWNVRTFDNSYAGPETVAAATLQSDNTVYARLALDVGSDAIVSTAKLLGITTPLTPTPSLALGSEAVTPLDMASVYATLAAGGVHAKPFAVSKVVFPGGKVDASLGRPQLTRVIPDWVASTVTRILEQNMLHGTGVGAHVPGRIDAGKTGTTDNYADAWFCGYTPRLEATVWIGYPQGEIPMLDVHGAAVSGPTLPATTWRLFMEGALAGTPNLAFPPPTTASQFGPWTGRYAYTTTSS